MYGSLHISRAMYYRLLIPECLPQYDKVLYLDCDLVVMSSLSELIKVDMGECLIGGVVDYPDAELADYAEKQGLDCRSYINSGVLLINCKAFAEAGIREQAFAKVQACPDLRYPDQDLINVLCKGRICQLPGVWNVQAFKKYANLFPEYKEQYALDLEHAKILHYSTHLKPWRWLKVPMGEVWWRYTNPTYYEADGVWFAHQFAALPVFACSLPKKILKKWQTRRWQHCT